MDKILSWQIGAYTVEELLAKELLANTVGNILLAIALFVVTYVVLAILWQVILSKMQAYAGKTKTRFDDIIVDVLRGVGVPFYVVVSLYVAVQPLVLLPIVNVIVKAALLIVIIAEVIKVLERVIHFFLLRRVKGEQQSKEEKKVSLVFSVVIKLILWSIGFLLILSNLGFDVTSLIAGLGIVGIAISLALQNILGDMFSSFSIAMDKPFEEGDFIVVGEHKGTVKHIGLKTTRIQSLQGEEIVISNNELTTARVQNFKKMEKRRIVFNIGVTYDTPVNKLRKIPKIIRQCIESAKQTEFDRAHFKEFGDFSLNFEIVYYMLTSDYVKYVNAQQSINFAVLEEFEKEGIEIAFPTQTVHVEKG